MNTSKKNASSQTKPKGKGKKSIIKQRLPAAVLAALSAVLLSLFPDTQNAFTSTVTSYSSEMISIFPAVLIIMGLMMVFVSNEFISRHLGSESGLKGMAVSFLLGTLPSGPLYMAFPMAAALRAKGARTANMVIFLSAWACIKIPQEMVELRFLGLKFMSLRLVFTIIFVLIMGLIIEKFDTPQKGNLEDA
ncbi:MAG: permease [Spirochaetia bacterium]|nr:permease [Spirochaetia bacterium]